MKPSEIARLISFFPLEDAIEQVEHSLQAYKATKSEELKSKLKDNLFLLSVKLQVDEMGIEEATKALDEVEDVFRMKESFERMTQQN